MRVLDFPSPDRPRSCPYSVQKLLLRMSYNLAPLLLSAFCLGGIITAQQSATGDSFCFVGADPQIFPRDTTQFLDWDHTPLPSPLLPPSPLAIQRYVTLACSYIITVRVNRPVNKAAFTTSIRPAHILSGAALSRHYPALSPLDKES